MYIVIMGDLIHGYKFVGPFSDAQKARDWVKLNLIATEDYEIVSLRDPAL